MTISLIPLKSDNPNNPAGGIRNMSKKEEKPRCFFKNIEITSISIYKFLDNIVARLDKQKAKNLKKTMQDCSGEEIANKNLLYSIEDYPEETQEKLYSLFDFTESDVKEYQKKIEKTVE